MSRHSLSAMLALGLCSLAASANAQVSPSSIDELSKRTVTMPKPADCKSLGICDLKSVKLIETKIKVLLPNDRPEFATYMTKTNFVIDFDKTSSIPQYGIIQFLKGCMFESSIEADGTETRRFRYVHEHFGQYKLIHHADFVVDSSHADPLATSFEGHGRFDLYRWNKDAKNYETDGSSWYFNGRPPHGTVFKNNLIANTGLIEGASKPTARNSSLEFETCIFKIADVPSTSDETGTGVDRAKALWCASWDHKFGYSFARGKVIAEKSINPTCREPVR